MSTNSVIINKIAAIFRLLNRWFEYSSVFKVLAAIGNAGKTSFFVTLFMDIFCRGIWKDYYEGSILLHCFVKGCTFVMNLCKRIFAILAKANRSSLNKAMFLWMVSLFNRTGGALACFAGAGGGLFLIKGLLSLFGGDRVGAAYLFISMPLLLAAIVKEEFMMKALKGCLPYKAVHWFIMEG